jgi:prolyl-tRNA synthetase
LVGLNLDNPEVKEKAEQLYNDLQEKCIEVLFDDRTDTSTGEKFSDADLIGIPSRVVISKKTLENESKIEFKNRNSKESSMLNIGEIIDTI